MLAYFPFVFFPSEPVNGRVMRGMIFMVNEYTTGETPVPQVVPQRVPTSVLSCLE